jgi:uncharacterized protein YgfB (UPF0149 family)
MRARRQQAASVMRVVTLAASRQPAARVPKTLPALPEVDAACRALALAVSASELHGSLCGWLAGGGAAGPDWLAKVMVDDALPAPAADGALDGLRRASVAQFEDRDFGFALLVPREEASLAVRSGALFDWCRGFVGAFGLAAGAEPPLSEEGREALADLARLAAATAQEDGDEEDEDALVEIEEFVRVAVLLLHGDCALGPRHRGRLN